VGTEVGASAVNGVDRGRGVAVLQELTREVHRDVCDEFVVSRLDAHGVGEERPPHLNRVRTVAGSSGPQRYLEAGGEGAVVVGADHLRAVCSHQFRQVQCSPRVALPAGPAGEVTSTGDRL
jgi:hypothetical protein